MEAGHLAGTDEGPLSGSGGPPRQLGRYRIVAELGRGSTSIVYLAVRGGPRGFNKLFALKQLRHALAGDPAFVAMFLAEARLGARLSHPNVVSTLEIEDGEALPYIVMEYLDGQSLHQVVTSARVAFTPIPFHMHLAAISGAVEGLGYAHAAVGLDGAPLDVVHRDVSPHNIFVTFSGLPKVLDFGIAQTSDSPNMMPPSAGRAAYMSPEQAAGESVDARSDLFSLGVMLWEAATRKRFWGDAHDKAEILRALASRSLPQTRVSALASVDPEVQSLVLRATAPERGDRYPTASALQEDLQAVLRRITPPASSPRELGRRMTTLFVHERARLQTAIDAQLEIARDAAAGERTTLHPIQTEVAATTPPPEDALPVERVGRAASRPTSDPVPAVETAISRPLPPVALSRGDTVRRWIAQHQSAALAALLVGLAAGGAIALLRAHDDSIESSRAPSAVAAPKDVAPAATVVAVPPVDRPAVDPSREANPAPPPPALASAQSAPAEPPVDVEALPRAWRSPRPLLPRGSEAPRAPQARTPSSLAPAAPSLTQASRVPEPGPPFRPIDSVNPYGP